ncbi:MULTISPECIES: HlyD family secretion protein [Deefgea]|uniref:Biotin/lipoyl-binding protein n=1 Tax=Deefgea chitinilytica TaxID=570276 RepID=A0ABS2CF50_9NEIS|nr:MULTISPECIES: HlyD family secretion protein [Deefgea]MBM5572632.1 biotin/lipoyl-binding protein [Deefgea chitinilytica]MBM9889868.1 HlyD family secretion protein [Deefgea sp. CFH1-16]
MLEIIIGGYAFLVWLLCIKLKVIPWNIKTQVGAVSGGLALAATIILTINVVTPSSSDVRAINYVVEVVPRVSGTVTRVAIEGNQRLKKGDVLLEIDSTPYRLKVKQLEAQVADATASAKTLWQDLDSAKTQTIAAQAHLDLMKKRLGQAQELAKAGAGNQFDVENFATEVKKAESSVANAKTAEARVTTKLEAVVGPDIASVAQIKAQLEAAKYDLESTIIRAPTDGYAVNVAVRPGNFLTAMPFRPAMSFVEHEQRIVAFFEQNELRFIKPGDKAEIAFKTLPGDVVRAKVDSIVWANSQGQTMQSGAVPNMPMEHLNAPLAQKFAVKLTINPENKPFIPMGARGGAAVYTEKLAPLHLLRMVMIRAQSLMNYLVLKLH